MTNINRRDGIRMITLATAATTAFLRTARSAPQAKVCLITGCSSGFGRLTALELARRGHRVWASMRDIDGSNQRSAQELADIANQEGLFLRTIGLDVRDDRNQENVIEEIMRTSGKLEVLINNAGIIVCTPADCVTSRLFQLQFETNVTGPARLSSRVLEVMDPQSQGHIIGVSSTVGRLNFPGLSLYCSSKQALESHFEILSREYKNTALQFSIVQPGPYRTDINPNAVRILEQVTLPEIKRERPLLYAKRAADLQALVERFQGRPSFDPQEVATLIANRVDGTLLLPEDGLRFPVGHGPEIPTLERLNQVHHWAQKTLE